MNRYLTLGVLLLCLTGVLAQQYPRRKPPKPIVKIPEMDTNCLNCICQASSDCDESLKCHNGAGGSYFCGPFVISWAYWHDAGRPGDKGRAHDFEACLNNKTCAGEAVRGYMRKYGRDCDGNGVIDCDDFARIHKLGYGSCGSDSFPVTEYSQKYEACQGYSDTYNHGGANDGGYGGANDEGYGGANDARSYDDANSGVDGNGDNLGVFVDYGDDHIQARDARMGG